MDHPIGISIDHPKFVDVYMLSTVFDPNIKASISGLASLTLIEKLIPSESLIAAVLIPIKFAFESNSGPPLLPGFIAASVCMTPISPK